MKIKGKLMALALATLMLLGLTPLGIFAAAVEEKAMTTEAKSIYDTFSDDFIKSEAKADDGYIGIPVHLYIYTEGKKTDGTRDVIFYVINHAGERIGRESDKSIIADYLAEGFVVIVVDYLKSPLAVSPGIEHSLATLRTYYMVNKTGFSGTGLSVRKNYAYFLPAGYRLARDIVYWEQDIHASYGTLNHIVSVWNKQIAGQKKVNGKTAGTAATIDDCTKPDGSPLDFRLRLDIIYPSEPAYETPVYAMAATQAEMHMHTCEIDSCQLVGFTFNGYTAVTFDYVYVPMARADHFGYISSYGTHGYNAAKMARAAIRCIRYYAEKFGYNDELIGVGGISKGTPPPSFLSIIGNKDVPEVNHFASDPNGDRFEGDILDANGRVIESVKQPFLTYEGGYDGKTPYYGTDADKKGEISSEITVAYCAAGDGANWMYGSTSGYDRVPMVLSCGKLDEYGCWGHWPSIVAHFENNAVNPFLAMGMEEQGHVYPTGYDPILGYDRYPQMLKFFDYYLKPERYTPSVVWMTPLDGADRVAIDAELEVKFISPMDPSTLKDGLVITDANGKAVEGEWVASELNTRFLFRHKDLTAGTLYTVTAKNTLLDKDGKAFAETFKRTFVTEGNQGFTPIADTYVSSAEPYRVFGKESVLSLMRTATDERLIFVSYQAEALSGAKMAAIRIPGAGAAIQTVSVYAINGYTVDEDTLCYANMPEFGSLYLGDYTLSDGGILLDAEMLTFLISKPSFTLVLRAAASDVYAYSQDFDGLSGTPKRDNSTFNKCWSENGLLSVGGSPSGYSFATVDDGAGGTTKAFLITAAHSYDRIKFFNTLSDDEMNANDIDRVVRVSFRVMTDHDGEVGYGWMSANGGSRVSGYSGPASSYNQGFYQGASVKTRANQWVEVTADYVVDATMVETQTGMFTVQTNSGSSANTKFYVDDIVISDVVPESNLASREQADASKMTLLLGARDTFAEAQVSVFNDENQKPQLPSAPEDSKPAESDKQDETAPSDETDKTGETAPSDETEPTDENDGGAKRSIVPAIIGAVAAVIAAAGAVAVALAKKKKK